MTLEERQPGWITPTLVVATLATITVALPATAIGGPITTVEGTLGQPVCSPHPSIRITEDAGDRGFVLEAGTPTYRPGSGVVAGLGTEENPYLITGWCIDGGALYGSIGPKQDQGILIEDTSAHVVLDDVRVSGQPGSGILLSNAENVTIRDVNVSENWEDGIRVRGGSNIAVHQSRIAGNDAVGVSTPIGPVDALAIQDTTVTGNRGRGIDIWGGPRAPTLRGNTITHTGADGVVVGGHPGAIVEGNTVVDNDARGMIIESSEARVANNTIEENRFAGLTVGGPDATVVNNTAISNGWRGIQTYSTGVVLESNRAEDNGRDGIAAYSRNAQLYDNTATDNGRDGIVADYAILEGNEATENDRDGFLIRGEGSTLDGNIANDNEGNGVTLKAASRTTVTSTTIQGNGAAGVEVLGDPWRDARDVRLEANEVAGNGIGVVVGPNTDEIVLRANNLADSTGGVGLDAAPNAGTVDARRNWWGCPDGPADSACDGIQGDALVEPWLTAPNADAGAG